MRNERTQWKFVDWSKATKTIAAQTGYSMSYVSSMRAAYAPHTLAKRTCVRWALLDWSKSDSELAAETGASTGTIGLHRKSNAPDTCTDMKRWKAVDWKRPNAESIHPDSKP